MINYSDKFISVLYDLSLKEISPKIILKIKECLIDYLGVTLAGSELLREKGENIIGFNDILAGEINPIGYIKKTSLMNAVLLNGMSAHIADLDDGVRQGSVHPGAPIFSVLIPLAQIGKINTTQFLKGVIVGYEAAVRLASAIQPSHRNKGYHATGTCSSIGVAMGVSAALGFSKQQMKNALTAAATSSSGLLNVTKGKSELKPFNAGQAAVSGLMAGLVANAGFIGSDDVLTGDWGYLNMVTDNIEKLYFESNNKLAIELVYMKPYAACRHCHPAIDAILNLRNKYNIKTESVAHINVQTYALGTKGHDHTDIDGITSAKMSTPFSVAVALRYGKADIDQFSQEIINDDWNLALTKKVSVVLNDELNKLVPKKRPAIIEIVTSDGNTYTDRIDLAKGEPETPMKQNEIHSKFISLAKFGGKTTIESEQLFSHIWNLKTESQELFNNL